MELTIESFDEVPAELRSGSWQFSTSALAPGRMASAVDDTRWATTWFVASSHGQVLGAVNSRSPRSEQFLNGALDLRERAELLGRLVPDDPRRWAFIGSNGELASGTLTSAVLTATEATEVRTALVSRAFGEAEEAGKYAAALYVRDQEVDAFASGLAARATVHALASTAELPLLGGDMDAHIAALPAGRRAVCRRDRRKFAALGHGAECVPAEDVIAEAAPLVCAVKRKYGVTDHPRLCAYRLRQWVLSLGPGACHASVVRDAGGALLAVSFFAVQDAVLESYEIGLLDELPGREWCYLQALIHGPVEWGLRHGCRSVDLGLDSSVVKKRRGASIGTAWAVSGA
ncbi:hypothetical protein [Streptomyces albidoflavus]|uniref:hypothetical protein n=1 Tax=Streptomyces albidoflavus TaxID=1886 RepID=UPI0033EA2AE2